MLTQTGFSENETISHDGAENRVEYEEEDDIPELPERVEISESGLDINYSRVGNGFRDRYQFDALAEGEDQEYDLEVTVTEVSNSVYNVRATYVEDDSQVFTGQLEDSEDEVSDEGEFLENKTDVVTELNGERLERKY